MGIFLIVASGVVGALFSLGYKFNRPVSTRRILVLMSALASLLSVCAMALWGEWQLSLAGLATGIPQGAATFAGISLFFAVSLRSRLSVSWTIIQFYVVVPFLVSLLVFGDAFTLRGAAGLVMILGSILLFGRKNGDAPANGGPLERRLVLMLLLSTLCSGIANAMSKVYAALDVTHPPFPMILMSSLSFFFLAAASSAAPPLLRALGCRRAARSDGRPSLPGETFEQQLGAAPGCPVPTSPGVGAKALRLSLAGIGISGWMGLMQLVSSALLIVGLTHLAGTIAYPIRIVVNIIGVVFFSRLFFAERLNRSEWAGTAVAIAGVALVASSA